MVMTVLLVTLLAAGSIAAAAYYFLRKNRLPAAFFISLRALLLLSLLCALFEPRFGLETLETKQPIVPVLVDASMSMRLFKPDSSVKPFLRCLDSLKGSPAEPIRFAYYWFGDSVREMPASPAPVFSDLQSILPGSFREKTIRDAPFIVLVSDGNLSNTSPSKGILRAKTCYYLKLPPVSPLPGLHAELLAAPETVPLDSSSTASVRISGFNPGIRSVRVACRQGTVTLAQHFIKADSGYFSDTLSIRLPSAYQGRFVYSITALNPADSLRSTVYFPQTVVPRQFRARIGSNAPLLDRRFLSLALQGDPQWRLGDQESRQCDALFMINTGSLMPEALSVLHPKGVAVFLGALPCSSGVGISPVSFSLFPNNTYDTLFGHFLKSDIPPPSILQVCLPAFLNNSRTVLSCLVRTASEKSERPDTVPFLTAGRFRGYTAIAVAGTELWRMDFWPLSLTKESESPTFMRYISALTKGLLVSNLSGNLFVYPSSPELYEYDSLPFTILLPSTAGPAPAASGASEMPSGPGNALRFTASNGSGIVIDTVVRAVSPGVSGMASFKLPPLSCGAYRYTCSMTMGTGRINYADSFFVSLNRLEYSVQAQNTVLLNEFALPLGEGTAGAVRKAYAAHAQARHATVTEYLEIRQSWILLAIIVAFFTLEWVGRKKSGLD
jgi:hypothetical protein